MRQTIITALLIIMSTVAVGQLPDAPKPGKLFWGEVSGLTLMNVADGVSTLANVHTGGQEYGSPWLYGRKPTAKSYFLPALGIEAGTALVSYKLQKSQRRGYRLLGHGLMIWQTGVHTRAFISNITARRTVVQQDCLTMGTCQF